MRFLKKYPPMLHNFSFKFFIFVLALIITTTLTGAERVIPKMEVFQWMEKDDLLRMLFRLGIAAFCGFIIGFEREFRGKAAGLRTYMLITIGSCLFMLVSEHVAILGIKLGSASADPARIAAQVVSGIGFLGAGAIIQHRAGVSGLTSAAGIWGCAAIGLAIGTGMIEIGVISSIGYVLTLEFFAQISKYIYRRRFNYMRLEVMVKKGGKIHHIRRALRELPLTFSQETTEAVLDDIRYNALLYFRGDLDSKIFDHIASIKGVLDLNLLPVNRE